MSELAEAYVRLLAAYQQLAIAFHEKTQRLERELAARPSR